MNESPLDDKEVLEALSQKFLSYFEINTQGDVSGQVVWEAHKAVMRGELIAYGSHIKTEKRKEIADLLDRIQDLETKHKSSFEPADAQQLEITRVSLAQCLDRRVKDKHRYFAHHFYEQGNKCGWVLVRQVKKQQDRFYASLYSIPSVPSGEVEESRVEEIRKYLKESTMPVLPSSVLEGVEGPLIVEELGRVVNVLPPGKVLGRMAL